MTRALLGESLQRAKSACFSRLTPLASDCSAVEQMYQELAGRHRARWSSIQIIDTKEVAAGVRATKRAEEGDSVDAVKRTNIMQFAQGGVRFPLAHRIPRASRKGLKTTFKTNRPTTFYS